jgi:TonB family protein
MPVENGAGLRLRSYSGQTLQRLFFLFMTFAFAGPALAEESTFMSELSQHIARFRYYPASASVLNIQGTAMVSFTLTRDGSLLDPSIVKSAGDEDLDQAALETLKKAQPLPKIPESVTGDKLKFTLPMIYRLSKAAMARAADTELAAFMAGKCNSANVGGQAISCKYAAYSLTKSGRSNFKIALEDRDDTRRAIAFSGVEARKPQSDIYEVFIDKILLYSKDRPKDEGEIDPLVKAATGTCRQIGDFARRKLSNLTCSATDEAGQVYSIDFASDGSPIKVRSERDERLVTRAKQE